MIECDQCGGKYKVLYADTKQGVECAADVFVGSDDDKYIIGHYGSYVADGHLYRVLTGEYIKGIICDECIKKGIDNNELELLASDKFFGDI